MRVFGLVEVEGRWYNNVITNEGKRHMMRLLGNVPGGLSASHIAIGYGPIPDNQSLEASSALIAEVERKELSVRVMEDDFLHLAAVFKTREGTGLIREMGLFTSGAPSAMVDSCDALGSWQPSAKLSIEKLDFKEGSGCLKHTNRNTSLIFGNDALLPVTLPGGNSLDDYVQFWYYVSDATGVSNVSLSFGSDANNYYRWEISGLESGWNYISLRFRNAQIVGSPNINNLVSFRLLSNYTIGTLVERLDRIRLFRQAGDLLAYVPISLEKALVSAWTVHWYIGLTEVGEMALEPFAYEAINVWGNSDAMLTSAVYAPTNGSSASCALITVEKDAIRYRQDGGGLSGENGHLVMPGGVIRLESLYAISNFRARAVGGGAVIRVTYLR